MGIDRDYFYRSNDRSPDKQLSIRKWGNSQGIRLSKDDLNKAGFFMEDTLNIYVEENQIILEKPTKHQTLEERFAHYEGDYNPEEWETGDSIGKEIL